MNEAKTRAVERLYNRIAEGEMLTDKEYEFINNYELEILIMEKKKKTSDLDNLIKNGGKLINILDKAFPSGK